MTNTRRMDLRRLNSVTKYPSILTYHGLGEKGSLLDVRNVEFDGLTALVTEKVDGTNSRVILMPDGVWLIGSREELLHASGDLIHNPAMGIVDELSETAGRLARDIGAEPDVITTVYVETYKKKPPLRRSSTRDVVPSVFGCSTFLGHQSADWIMKSSSYRHGVNPVDSDSCTRQS